MPSYPPMPPGAARFPQPPIIVNPSVRPHAYRQYPPATALFSGSHPAIHHESSLSSASPSVRSLPDARVRGTTRQAGTGIEGGVVGKKVVVKSDTKAKNEDDGSAAMVALALPFATPPTDGSFDNIARGLRLLGIMREYPEAKRLLSDVIATVRIQASNSDNEPGFKHMATVAIPTAIARCRVRLERHVANLQANYYDTLRFAMQAEEWRMLAADIKENVARTEEALVMAQRKRRFAEMYEAQALNVARKKSRATTEVLIQEQLSKHQALLAEADLCAARTAHRQNKFEVASSFVHEFLRSLKSNPDDEKLAVESAK